MKLTRRDQLLLVLAMVVLTGWIGLQLGLRPLLDQRAHLERVVAVRQQNLVEIQQLALEYATLRAEEGQRRQILARRADNTTLFGFLDEQAGRAGVKPHIVFMKPSETDGGDASYRLSTVEMKLQGLDLPKVTRFLSLIEKSAAFENTLSVRRFALTRGTGATPTLEMVLLVESLAS